MESSLNSFDQTKKKSNCFGNVETKVLVHAIRCFDKNKGKEDYIRKMARGGRAAASFISFCSVVRELAWNRGNSSSFFPLPHEKGFDFGSPVL